MIKNGNKRSEQYAHMHTRGSTRLNDRRVSDLNFNELAARSA